MRVVEGQIEAYVEMQDFMIGNVAFQILHGGLAATVLDSVGGIVAMGELYKKLNRKRLQIPLKYRVWRRSICGWIIWRLDVANILLHVQKPYVWGVRAAPCA